MHLDRAQFLEIIRLTPLIAIDLIVRDEQGRVLLGRRRNNPAKGSYFVPGGRIRKGERLDEAFARISRQELGVELRRADADRYLGVYEHIYDDNVDNADFGTHYVVNGWEVRLPSALVEGDFHTQHEDVLWLTVPTLLAHPEVHENTKAYFHKDVNL